MTKTATCDMNLESAFDEWTRLPMPSLDQNHIFDRSKFQLEEEAIRKQIRWVARKYGVTFKELDGYIEQRSRRSYENRRTNVCD